MIGEMLGSFMKAKLEIEGTPKEVIPCTFNPSQYTVKRNVKFGRNQKLGGAGKPQFTGVSNTSLDLDLFFDSSSIAKLGVNAMNALAAGKTPELKPVTTYTDKLLKMVSVKGSEHKTPKVTFCWGDMEFSGHVTSMTQTFTMFTINGMPIRAKVKLTIENRAENPPLESPDRTKYRTFTEGMSLWMLAYEEYGDCEKWRVIAKANGLLNPLDAKPGQMIRIPAL